MKVVVNRCYGGYSLSKKACEFLGLEWDGYGYAGNKDFGIESDNYNDFRKDKRLVECVEKLGEEASGRCANLEIVYIPDDIEWEITEYDGYESVEEKHRRW